MEALIMILGISNSILLSFCTSYYFDLKRTERILKFKENYIKHLEDEK